MFRSCPTRRMTEMSVGYPGGKQNAGEELAMKSTTGRNWVLGALALGVAGVALAQAGSTLVINGNVASTDVRVINGKAYVPIADVA